MDCFGTMIYDHAKYLANMHNSYLSIKNRSKEERKKLRKIESDQKNM